MKHSQVLFVKLAPRIRVCRSNTASVGVFPGVITETGSRLDPYENFVRNDYIFELSENDKVALALMEGIAMENNFRVYLYKVETSEFEHVSMEW